MIKKIKQFLFPDWKDIKQATGEWNIHVTTDLFGDYNETKYCWFYLKFSKRLNLYKVFIDGYRPKEHKLYDTFKNTAIDLNKILDKYK